MEGRDCPGVSCSKSSFVRNRFTGGSQLHVDERTKINQINDDQTNDLTF